LARKRGVELNNQTVISQRVIEEMQDGVLVLNRSGWVKQHNRVPNNCSAWAILGAQTGELFDELARWFCRLVCAWHQ